MTTSTAESARHTAGRTLLNKVPEVTIWFWIIKILCTTVGESFADYINGKLASGLGLTDAAALGWTAVIFTVVFVAVIGWQFATKRYTPFPYWLTVVVVSVTGTLYTDLLTDNLHVRLWVSSLVFSVLLAIVFGAWWVRERTLSIHAITTRSREAWYWLTVLVTFALGTATGDWTLELTNWSPAHSILLPLGLIVSITALWKFGANPVLSFWLAYVLTRPLGANIGDALAQPRTAVNAGDPTGLGLGTFWTSILFLGAILATVIYLTITRSDVIETYDVVHPPKPLNRRREQIGLVGFAIIAAVAAAVMAWAHNQPHATCDPTGASETMPACPKAALTGSQATQAVSRYEAFAHQAIAEDKAGKTAASHATVQKMRDQWDADSTALDTPARDTAWHAIDNQMDAVLESYGIDHANKPFAPAVQEQRVTKLLTVLAANKL